MKINIVVLFFVMKIDKKGIRLNMYIYDKNECVLVYL